MWAAAFIKLRAEIAVGAAEVDVVLDGPPALPLGYLEEVLVRARRGLLRGCRHRGLLVPQVA
jgi:hypothetical protein